jgi:hypothetical protein
LDKAATQTKKTTIHPTPEMTMRILAEDSAEVGEEAPGEAVEIKTALEVENKLSFVMKKSYHQNSEVRIYNGLIIRKK